MMVKTADGKYVFEIVWTVPGAGKTCVSNAPAITEAEAFARCKELATIFGWRRPKWWDLHRWRDKTYDHMQ